MMLSSRFFPILLPLMFALSTTPAASQSRPYAPPRGSVERQQIMDAFRGPVTRYFGRTVIFQNVQLRVQNGWAMVQAEPRTPTGQTVVDIDDPRCQPNCTEVAVGLLHWSRGRWIVVRHVVSPGEFPYEWQNQLPEVPVAVWPWNWPNRG
jgi:hypothetical protein